MWHNFSSFFLFRDWSNENCDDNDNDDDLHENLFQPSIHPFPFYIHLNSTAAAAAEASPLTFFTSFYEVLQRKNSVVIILNTTMHWQWWISIVKGGNGNETNKELLLNYQMTIFRDLSDKSSSLHSHYLHLAVNVRVSVCG
jgi:hypothetical protein